MVGYNAQFASGEDAARAIGVDSDLAAKYMAVSGGVSASYAVKKTFQKNYQYGLFAYNEILIHVELEDFAAAVDENLQLQRKRRIDKFDSQKTEIIQQYKSLFSTMGTHIITAANYGGRLQLVSLVLLPIPYTSHLTETLVRMHGQTTATAL